MEIFSIWKQATLFFKWRTKKFAKLIAKVIATKINSHQVMPLKHKKHEGSESFFSEKISFFPKQNRLSPFVGKLLQSLDHFYELIISFSRWGNKKFTKLAQGEDCHKNNLHLYTAVIGKQRNSLRNSERLSRFRQIT